MKNLTSFLITTLSIILITIIFLIYPDKETGISAIYGVVTIVVLALGGLPAFKAFLKSSGSKED